jgi:hypothetical protein
MVAGTMAGTRSMKSIDRPTWALSALLDCVAGMSKMLISDQTTNTTGEIAMVKTTKRLRR